MRTAPLSLRMNRSVLLRAFAACALAGASAAAFAASCPAKTSSTAVTPRNGVRVSYRDLDLTTASGNRALYERIDSAARKVCELGDIRLSGGLDAGAACRRAAVSEALHAVHAAHATDEYALNLPRA